MSRKKLNRKEREERLARARMERERRSRNVTIVGIAAIAIILGGFALYYFFGSGGDLGEYAPAENIGPEAGSDQIKVPASDVGTGARFYTYDSGGTTVRFFMVKGDDGDIHVATDACDVCYSNHKGYHQSGDKMQCNNCGQTFAINNIGTKNTAGGCWPSYLPMKLQDGNVLVDKSDLDAKAYMFR